jgi:hypothetical protein
MVVLDNDDDDSDYNSFHDDDEENNNGGSDEENYQAVGNIAHETIELANRITKANPILKAYRKVRMKKEWWRSWQHSRWR